MLICVQVDIHHCGVLLFKGLSEPANVVQISRSKWAQRTLTALQLNKKAKILGAGKGLLCTIRWRQ